MEEVYFDLLQALEEEHMSALGSETQWTLISTIICIYHRIPRNIYTRFQLKSIEWDERQVAALTRTDRQTQKQRNYYNELFSVNAIVTIDSLYSLHN